MADAVNKVEFGISTGYVASYTVSDAGVITIGTPAKLEGLVSFEVDESISDMKFFADNILYYAEKTSGGMTATLTAAVFTKAFKKAYLGYVETTDGALAKPARPQMKPFCLLFQGEGDATETRHIFYNCMPGPIKRSWTTVEDNKTIDTEEIELTIIGTYGTNIVHCAYLKANTAYSGLTTAFPVPALPASP